MVWGCIDRYGARSLRWIKGRLNSEKYQDIIVDEISNNNAFRK